MHGDLRCPNVVVDENDDAHIIDIVDGEGYMDAWTCLADKNDDPKRDIYSIGVTLWETAHNRENPVHLLKEVNETVSNEWFDSLLLRTGFIQTGRVKLYFRNAG